MPRKITSEIPPGSRPKRLDVALHDMGVFSSRSQAKQAIENGDVKILGGKAKPGYLVKPGDRVEVFLPDPKPAKPQPEDIPLKIVYEDRDILVIDKPAGIVTHPAAGNYSGTIVNAVLFHCHDLSSIGGVMRPGVVHRLDKDTSGLLVIAKNDAAHQSLSKQFHDRTVEKSYLAIVHGRMPTQEGRIESAIGRDPASRIKMRGALNHGRNAVTQWKEIEAFPGASLLELKPLTGRTHQIRVHLSEMKHPVVADKLYGSKAGLKNISDTRARAALANMKRQALHAHRLTVTHPATGEKMTFESPLPDDMQRTIEELRSAATKT